VLSEHQLESFLGKLGAEDFPLAYKLMWTLVLAPDQAVPFIEKHLLPIPQLDRQRFTGLLKGLDSKDDAVREQAMKELDSWGEQAEPLLRRELAAKQPGEKCGPIEELLQKMRLPPHSGRALRAVRAIQVLEYIGSAQAAIVLKKLAAGMPEARLTQDASEALARIAMKATSAERVP
jgi:hypothetical protein